MTYEFGRPVTKLQECGRCRRPAKLRALYARSDGGEAILAGRLGPACFYIVAGQVSRSGYRPEREDATPIILRPRS